MPKKLITTDFITKAKHFHGDRYSYSKVDYKNSRTKVCIICKVHGDFWQKPNCHLRPRGCPKCAYITRASSTRNKIKNILDKCNIVHNFKYDYSKVIYKNNKTKVCIICPKHGIFWQNIINHLFSKAGCPKCKQSKGEREVERWLAKKQIDFIPQKRFDQCKNKRALPFDFYLPKVNTCIEYDGEQHFRKSNWWFSNQVLVNQKIKDEYCLLNSIRLIRVPFWKRDFIPQILTEALRVSSLC